MENLNIYLNIVGLIFDIVGFYILFENGLPSKLKQSSGGIIQEESDEELLVREKSNKRIKKFADLALILITIGFIFQITSSITSMYSNKSSYQNPKPNCHEKNE